MARMKSMRAREEYGTYGKSKRTMRKDGAMIHEDWSAPALLPRELMDKEWPRSNHYMSGGVQDLFQGVQKQLEEDSADLRRIFSPKNY